MTRKEVDKILEDHVRWLEGNGGKRADFRYADLQGVDLQCADLRYADFRYADLQGADLQGADLRYADFRYADLQGADLQGADLRYADFRYADLRYADFQDAGLQGADLRYADLRYADFRDADLQDADLQDAGLHGADLSRSIGLTWADCSFSAHGENGRRLIAVVIGAPVFFCGCFRGSEQELRDYIAAGEKKYAESRTMAMEFCLRAIEMSQGGAS